MPITLKCAYASGSVAFALETIDGTVAHERRYDIVDGTVILDGYDDSILRHDAQMLVAMPNNLYWLPTPHEQEQMAQAKQAALTISEDWQSGMLSGVMASTQATVDVMTVPAQVNAAIVKSKVAKQSSDENGG